MYVCCKAFCSYRCSDKEAEDVRFANMLNTCQRHRHKPSYCGYSSTKACRYSAYQFYFFILPFQFQFPLHRFGYPFDLQTRTCFTWTLDKGTLKPARNDRWMNAYHVSGAQQWNANSDLKLIYNIDCLCQYLCAYACKPEGTSRAVLSTLKRCAELAEEDGRDVVGPSIRSAFIRAHGQRDMSAQVYLFCVRDKMFSICFYLCAGTCSL